MTESNESGTIESGTKQEGEKPFEGRPTLFISIMDDGDVEVGAVNQELGVDTAVVALELAKTKVISNHLRSIYEARQRAQAVTSLTLPHRPKIVRP